MMPRETVSFGGLALGSGFVQGHCGANQGLQRLLVYLLALVKVDGTPCVPVKTGVEEARRILQSRPFREGHLHDVLVSLTCADNSVVLPHWNPSPLPLLDDFGIGFLDQATEPAEHLAASRPAPRFSRLSAEKETGCPATRSSSCPFSPPWSRGFDEWGHRRRGGSTGAAANLQNI